MAFKSLKIKISCLFFIWLTTATAQYMEPGFQLLETGKYGQAESFFAEILKEYPNNKTARICYGRALGLNEQPDQALRYFAEILQEYPDDLEVQLNYAEALLWNKDYAKAKRFYTKLVEAYPQNFNALLGLANTYSNLMAYEEAQEMIAKALVVDPQNTNALTSLKYIRLGHAYQHLKAERHAEAIVLLEQNLEDFPLDAESLLNLAQVYLDQDIPRAAIATYNRLLKSDKPVNRILSWQGLALAWHKIHKQKKALDLARKAQQKAMELQNDRVRKTAEERLVQALLWNRKFKAAKQQISKLKLKYGKEEWVVALEATLGMYTGQFEQSISLYKDLLVKNSVSFDGNLGLANAYFANQQHEWSQKLTQQTLKLFPGQKDATALNKKILIKNTPSLQQKIELTKDNGDNLAWASHTQIQAPLSFKTRVLTGYSYRKTKNNNTDISASTQHFMGGIQHRFSPKLKSYLLGGIQKTSSNNRHQNQWTLHGYFDYKPQTRHHFQLGFKREIQDFNADLLKRNIAANHLYGNYNFNALKNWGWFTQYFYTKQSDENHRHLLFTSFYYHIMYRPVVKLGLNYQYLSFDKRRPEAYFSPLRFNAVEIFADWLQDEQSQPAQSVFYSLNTALGYQFIEDQKSQGTYRIQAKLGYKFSNRFLLNLYGLHSNIASATAAGFTFSQLGLRLHWSITSKPIFSSQK